MLTNEQKIKDLEKNVKKLERVIEAQRQFIDVLKTLPGNKGVKLKAEKRGKKKNGVSKRAQGKSGAVVTDSASREPKGNSASAQVVDANVTFVGEAKLQ